MYYTDGLPESKRLPIGTLTQLFRTRSNSYKYLFFLALLDRLEEVAGNPSNQRLIQLASLCSDMLAIAWHPHVLFRLSFGKQDGIAALLDSHPFSEALARQARRQRRTEVRQHFEASGAAAPLLRYVPQRLLRPFFRSELRGHPDRVVDAEIVRLAGKHFQSRRPLYRFSDDGNAIILHVEWWAYLNDNLPLIRRWALWEWLQYMQSRNPNTPNLAAKLVPSPQRYALRLQRDFWETAMRYWPETGGLVCPYTGKPVCASTYELDHFVPWAFVAHDRLWNLLPVHPRTNAQKSDNVPDQRYVLRVAEVHAHALHGFHTAMRQSEVSERVWISRTEDYVVDLRLEGIDDLLDYHRNRKAYLSHVTPLVDLASAHGFRGGWTLGTV
jgi:hypothetical protein